MKTSTRCVADFLSAGKISEDKPPDLGPGISIVLIKPWEHAVFWSGMSDSAIEMSQFAYQTLRIPVLWLNKVRSLD